MSKIHPEVSKLALLASGDAGFFSRIILRFHVRSCAECRQTVDDFAELRAAATADLPVIRNWENLALEMRANIRVGLEAGECVREPLPLPAPRWQPRFALAMASLLVLAGAGFFLRPVAPVSMAKTPVVTSTSEGIEFRSGETSLVLLNRNGAAAEHSVSAEGEVRARYIDGNTGSVTINNVYLQ